VPLGVPTTGATVLLARVAGRRVAFAADEDGGAIRRVALDDRSELEPIVLSAAPGPMVFVGGSRILTISRSAGLLAAVDVREDAPNDHRTITVIPVPAEPVGLALSPDRATVYVTSGWGRTLSAYRTADLSVLFHLELPREPRAVVVSNDGREVFVAHAVGGRLSVIDVHDLEKRQLSRRAVPLVAKDARPLGEFLDGTNDREARRRARERFERHQREGLPTCQSFALAKSSALPDRLFVPQVMVDPGEPEVKTGGYGSSAGGDMAEVPTVAVVESPSGRVVPGSMRRTTGDTAASRPACLLPRAATIDERQKTLLVACQGIDAVVAYDATSAAPAHAELGRWQVGSGPTGIAVDPEAREAVVWAQFDRTLGILALDQPRPVVRIATGPAAFRTAIDLGRALFHKTGDARISSDGRACASCHPDGRDDGLVWSTPDGPRRSIMLAGRLADTAPYSWQGNAESVQKHLTSTFARLHGSGLAGADLEALVGYLRALPTQPPRSSDASVAAGARIFASPKTGCSNCHSGPSFTDGALHDVGSGQSFNTPSLLNVASGGPWFHDGRYGSLQDLLIRSDGKMGHTKHLSPYELSYLESFLASL
jgi:DNA-binding beta-propeller fold protein YncE